MIKFKKEKSYSWTVAYLILLICFIASIALIFSFNNLVSKEINEKYCNALFDEISSNVTDELEYTTQMYTVLSGYDSLDEILKIESIDGYYKNDAIFDLIDRLLSVKSDADFYIYFPKSDTVASKTGFLCTQIYYDDYISKYNISYEEWMEKLHSEGSRAALSVECLDEYDIFLSEDYKSRKGENLYFVTKLRESDVIGNGFLSEWTENIDLFILDLSGNIYMSNSKHVKESSLTNIGSIKESYGDGWRIFEKMEYSILPMNVMIAYPENMSLAAVASYNKLQVLLCVFLILFNAGLVIHMLISNHKSISSIMKLFGVKHSRKGLKGIEENIGEILKINIGYSKQIRKSAEEKENLILEKCLNESYPKVEIRKMLKEGGIEFKYKYFTLCAFEVDNLENLFGEDGQELPLKEKFNDLTFILQNVLTELFAPYNCNVRTVPVEERILAIINVKDEINYNCQTVFDVLHQGTEFIGKNFFVESTFILSKLYSDVGALAESYAQVMHLIRYKAVMNIDGDLRYDENEEIGENYFEAFMNCDTEQKLINCITARNLEDAMFLIEHMFSGLEGKKMSLAQIQCIMTNLGCVLCKVPQNSVKIDFEEILSNSVSVDSMKEYTRKIIEEMCAGISPAALKSEKVMAVKAYIDERYYEGIDLNSLSDVFSISQNYLSASFKKEMGVSIPDYINRVRIRNAKQLFKNSDKSVKEVAERVGFTNVSTFDRIFKKYEGITPTAFKNNVRR